jgi:hypothetical protein
VARRTSWLAIAALTLSSLFCGVASAGGYSTSMPLAKIIKRLENDDEFMAAARKLMIVPEQKAITCATYGLDKYKYDGIYRLLHTYLSMPFNEFQAQTNIVYVQQKSLESYADSATLIFLNDLSKEVFEHMHLVLHVTALTTPNQQVDEDSHCGHRSGLSFDLRPLPGELPTSYSDAHYDAALNKKILTLVLSDKKISRVIFNDPNMLNDSDLLQIVNARAQTDHPVQFGSMDGHDNHFHVELYPNPYFDALTKSLIENLSSPDLASKP